MTLFTVYIIVYLDLHNNFLTKILFTSVVGWDYFYLQLLLFDVNSKSTFLIKIVVDV